MSNFARVPGGEPTPRAADPEPRTGAASSMVVEEIFLEGDSMTMLRHEAGSTHAVDLLEGADLRVAVTVTPGRR